MTVLAAEPPADAPTAIGASGLAPRLEREGLLIVDAPPFRLSDDERGLAERRWGRGRAKHASYNPGANRVDGAGQDPELARVQALLVRYGGWAKELIARYFPTYRGLEVGRASLRTRSAADPSPSWRKDDRRLHVDAFTSQPVSGRRILRVFSNIDFSGADREWAVGEGFEDHARRFLGRTRVLAPGEATLLRGLGLTKTRRTDYDQVMLGLHDAAKRDLTYQAAAPRRRMLFPYGATWVVFTDQTPHAALTGRGALEQTFYLPVEAMHDQGSSPLRILERLRGETLV